MVVRCFGRVPLQLSPSTLERKEQHIDYKLHQIVNICQNIHADENFIKSQTKTNIHLISINVINEFSTKNELIEARQILCWQCFWNGAK